jgi:hypothetical protein
MHKLHEIIQKVRINRKLIVDIGLVFLYTLGVVLFVFNTYMCVRNFNIAYIGYHNTLNSLDFSDTNNFDYTEDHVYRNMKQRVMKERANAANFPKNVVMVLISELNNASLTENDDMKEFINHLVEKENAARLFELQNDEFNETVPNWINIFTGTKTDLHGTPGNKFSEDIIKVDNVFRRLKENQIDNVVIGSLDLNNFLRKSVPDAEFLEADSSSKPFNDDNLIKYSDEIRFQNIMKIVEKKQKGYQYNKHLNITYDDRITKDQYYINYFAMVHFSNLLI